MIHIIGQISVYDIFYVSKGNIDQSNWQRVKEVYPTAQAVSDVVSLDQIKAKAFTKMFWVVWDDLELNTDLSDFSLYRYRATPWDDMYVHVFRNGEHFDGVCLFPKDLQVSDREFRNRFFVNKKEVDVMVSTTRSYDVFYPKSYQDYVDASYTASSDMFWVIWDNLKLLDSFDINSYKAKKWDSDSVHVFKNGEHFDGICLFSKNKIVSKKEFENRFFINKKEVSIQASMPKPYDIFFISYNEPNAEKNYQRLKEKFPNTKRIDKIKGIHQAHQAAAALSDTEMFWVVDGDAVLSPDFSFDFVSPYYERDTVRVWRSRNPVNDLVYGYGGVKLLPRDLTLKMKINSSDMTTAISKKFKAMNEISNITEFNVDPFNTWKSAFRECVKLSSKVIRGQLNNETEKRLEVWCSVGKDKPYGKFAIAGANLGKDYGEKHKDDSSALGKINDFDWLEQEFKKHHG